MWGSISCLTASENTGEELSSVLIWALSPGSSYSSYCLLQDGAAPLTARRARGFLSDLDISVFDWPLAPWSQRDWKRLVYDRETSHANGYLIRCTSSVGGFARNVTCGFHASRKQRCHCRENIIIKKLKFYTGIQVFSKKPSNCAWKKLLYPWNLFYVIYYLFSWRNERNRMKSKVVRIRRTQGLFMVRWLVESYLFDFEWNIISFDPYTDWTVFRWFKLLSYIQGNLK